MTPDVVVRRNARNRLGIDWEPESLHTSAWPRLSISAAAAAVEVANSKV